MPDLNGTLPRGGLLMCFGRGISSNCGYISAIPIMENSTANEIDMSYFTVHYFIKFLIYNVTKKMATGRYDYDCKF